MDDTLQHYTNTNMTMVSVFVGVQQASYKIISGLSQCMEKVKTDLYSLVIESPDTNDQNHCTHLNVVVS